MTIISALEKKHVKQPHGYDDDHLRETEEHSAKKNAQNSYNQDTNQPNLVETLQVLPTYCLLLLP